jgi:hypothetical protein
VDLVDCRLDAGHLLRKGALEGHDHLIGCHRVSRDQRPFQHMVEVGVEDGPVFEGARFTFGRVHDDRRGHHIRVALQNRSPLPPGGKPGTAAAPQA